MPRQISQERLLKDVMRVLNNPTLMSEIDIDKVYSRRHDDSDGLKDGCLNIMLGNEYDVWVTTDKHTFPAMRFRAPGLYGGGMSPRVYNALKILTLAIKLDNDDHPQRK